MKKLLCIFLTIIIIVLLSGCTVERGDNAFVTDRFIVLTYDATTLTSEAVICDTEAGVLYLYVSSAYQGAITPIMEPDGTPMTYDEYVPSHFRDIGRYADKTD
jgi:hypothetical protein